MLRLGALIALGALFAPAIGLSVAGVFAVGRDYRRVWRPLAGAAATSTLCWLIYVGLVQHETPCAGGTVGCPTIYGWSAPLDDDSAIGGILVVGGIVTPALVAGWRRLAPPVAIGASVIAGPTVLALGTAPRGDNDGLWALVFWSLATLGALAAVVAAVAARVATRRRGWDSEDDERAIAASAGDRLGALFIDIVVAGSVLYAPVTALSNAGAEVAAGVVGVTGAMLYLALPTARRGHSLGQLLLGIRVLDTSTRTPPPLPRAMVRSLVVAVEVIAAPTVIMAVPAIAELVALSSNGTTITDRLLRTTVVSRPSETALPRGDG